MRRVGFREGDLDAIGCWPVLVVGRVEGLLEAGAVERAAVGTVWVGVGVEVGRASEELAGRGVGAIADSEEVVELGAGAGGGSGDPGGSGSDGQGSGAGGIRVAVQTGGGAMGAGRSAWNSRQLPVWPGGCSVAVMPWTVTTRDAQSLTSPTRTMTTPVVSCSEHSVTSGSGAAAAGSAPQT